MIKLQHVTIRLVGGFGCVGVGLVGEVAVVVGLVLLLFGLCWVDVGGFR